MKILCLLTILAFSCQLFALDCQFLGHQGLGQAVLKELNQNPIQCKANSVHMTFDDGPSSNVTPHILKELEARKIQATFFVTTTNLAPEHSKYKENRALVLQTMKAGHLIANHGHQHDAYCLRMDGQGHVLDKGFSESEREAQVKRSMELLQWATEGSYDKQIPLLFRFPYGRGAMPSQAELKSMMDKKEITLRGTTYSEQLAEYRKISPPIQTLVGSGLSHLGWNHDSQDSSHPIKAPNEAIMKDYIIKNLKGLCSPSSATKVALFHDIKEMNISAVPVILDLGKCMGLKFISAKEMMKDELLNKTGVLIDKKDFLKGVASVAIDGLNDIANHPVIQCQEPVDKSCYSEQYQRRYKHCSGGDSVCFEGKWLSKTDPIIINNCH
jgi:peptidoglycan/xylan/chitin deacetylase (PgdA/CDA1 family)